MRSAIAGKRFVVVMKKFGKLFRADFLNGLHDPSLLNIRGTVQPIAALVIGSF